MSVGTIQFGNSTVYTGRKPASPPSNEHVMMTEVLQFVPSGMLPPIPERFGHGLSFGYKGWRMLGNGPDDSVYPGFQGCGDCAWAGPAHETMESNKQAGRPIPLFTGKGIVEQYSAYCGYDPQTGQNDSGSDVQEVLKWRQDKGLLDLYGTPHKIGKTVVGTPGDIHQLWAMVYLFECAGIGVNIQQAQENQINNNQPWDYVQGSPDVGGHYVPVMGNNGLITWGWRWGFTRSFYENQAEEVYAWVDSERYNRVTGKTAEGFTDQDIELFVTEVVKAKASL